ncbi:tyrosine-type recombinase/integrase [Mycobacterium intracellulare]|uniref:tyrosine-type recombinase/integrase n=1 Tax=Mycobacterium intracellulare TaxID=1767 RepID=UPI00355612B3
MASIRLRTRKDGSTYTAVLYTFEGKQTSSSFNDHGEALKFLDVCNRLGPPEARRIWMAAMPRQGHTVQSYITEHLEALSGVEKKTIAEYRRYLARDIVPVLGHIPLSTLSRADVSKWVNKMRADGASGKTIANKLGFLSGVLNLAVKAGEISGNPAAGIRAPRTLRREMTLLTKAEYQLLKASFTERWHPFLDFLVASGCRFSEATALKPGDVDRINGTVRITKAWKRTPGDGEVKYEIGQPKTRRSIRTINLPSAVLDQLDYSHEWLFVNTENGPIRLYSWRTNVWSPSLAKAMTKDANNPDKLLLTRRLRIHDLRHVCASWLLSEGVPLITVSAHLGHEDAATTARIYGHLDRAAGQAAAAAMTVLLT